MSALKFGTGLMAICLLAACGKKFEAMNRLSTLSPQGDHSGISTDYHETSTLTLLQTGEEVKGKAKAITLQGTGARSTYKISYKFHSGAATSFKILQTKLKSATKSCMDLDAELLLKNQNNSEPVLLEKANTVLPNTEYVLEARIQHEACPELAASLELLAWGGDTSVEPKKALICQSHQLGPTTFLSSVNMLSVMTSTPGKENFFSKTVYCGEVFGAGKGSCKGKPGLGLLEEGSNYQKVQCQSKRGNDMISSAVEFNHENQSVSMKCVKNASETFSEKFRDCVVKVIDAKSYQGIETP